MNGKGGGGFARGRGILKLRFGWYIRSTKCFCFSGADRSADQNFSYRK